MEVDFKQMKFTYVNNVMLKSTGYTKEEFLKLKPEEFFLGHSLVIWNERYEALKNGEFIDKTTEFRVKAKKGNQIWFLSRFKFFEGEDGVVDRANIVNIDITDKKVSQELLRRKEEEIYLKLEQKLHDWRSDLSENQIQRQKKLEHIHRDLSAMSISEYQD